MVHDGSPLGVACAKQNLVLIGGVELHKMAAPAPYAHDEVFVIFWMNACILQGFDVDGVQLKLVPAECNKGLYEGCDLENAFGIAHHGIVHFKRERAAVDGF